MMSGVTTSCKWSLRRLWGWTGDARGIVVSTPRGDRESQRLGRVFLSASEEHRTPRIRALSVSAGSCFFQKGAAGREETRDPCALQTQVVHSSGGRVRTRPLGKALGAKSTGP